MDWYPIVAVCSRLLRNWTPWVQTLLPSLQFSSLLSHLCLSLAVHPLYWMESFSSIGKASSADFATAYETSMSHSSSLFFSFCWPLDVAIHLLIRLIKCVSYSLGMCAPPRRLLLSLLSLWETSSSSFSLIYDAMSENLRSDLPTVLLLPC